MLVNASMPVAGATEYVFTIVLNFLKVIFFNSAFAVTFIAIMMQVAQALYLNYTVNKFKLFPKSSYVAAFAYITLSSLFPQYVSFNNVMIANWAMLAVIFAIFRLSQTTEPRKIIFNTGLVIGVATLIYMPAALYLILLLIAISIVRPFNIGEWLVAILGAITPVYFAAGLFYLYDVLHWLPDMLHLSFNTDYTMYKSANAIGVISGVFVLFITSVFVLQQQIVRQGVYIRRGWGVVIIAIFFSILAAVLAHQANYAAWLLIVPPMAIVVANAYYHEKSKAFSNFAFYFTILLVIFAKFYITV